METVTKPDRWNVSNLNAGLLERSAGCDSDDTKGRVLAAALPFRKVRGHEPKTLLELGPRETLGDEVIGTASTDEESRQGNCYGDSEEHKRGLGKGAREPCRARPSLRGAGHLCVEIAIAVQPHLTIWRSAACTGGVILRHPASGSCYAAAGGSA